MSSIPNAQRFLATGSDDLALANKVFKDSIVEQTRVRSYLYGSPLIAKMNVEGEMLKTAQFLMESDLDAPDDYQPGEYMAGDVAAVDEGTISVEPFITKSQTVPADHAMIAGQRVANSAIQGSKLAARIVRELDRRRFINFTLGARAAAATKNGLTVHTGGTRLTRGGNSAVSNTALTTAYPRSFVGAQRLREDLRLLRETLNSKGIDVEGAIPMLVIPYIDSVLRFDNGIQVGTATNTLVSGGSTLFSSDYQSTNNLHAGTMVKLVEGFAIFGTPQRTSDANGGVFPWGNQAARSARTPSKYILDLNPGATNGQPVALAFPRGGGGQYGVGEIQYGDMQLKTKFDEERTMTDFYRAAILQGSGVMHPWCCASIELLSAADGTVAVA